MALRENNLIYLAGTIDSDGHMTVNSLYGTPQICIKSTFFRLMPWLKENFGGYYYIAHKATKKWKTRWRWSLSGDNAIELIRDIYPFLLLKKDIALKVIEFQICKLPNIFGKGISGRFGKVTDEEMERRKIILSELKKLNKRGRGV